MKKLLLIAATLIVFSANAQTTVYHPFPDSNAVWNIHYWMYSWMYGTEDCFYSITFSGDTVIGTQSYHKLNTPFIQSNFTETRNGEATGYKGAIRHDAMNKKVYFVPPTTNTEQLLYDFTMQVGDTVQGYLETFASPPDIVQSIDSVQVGNSFRKRWIINTCYNISLIEGIGSTYGLIEATPGCITDLPDMTITCFQQNGQSLYPDTTTNCQLITSVNPISKNSGEIIISPNPSHGSFTISFEPNMNINEFRITDLSGKTMVHQQMDNQSSIKINNFQNGVYIFSTINNDNIQITKKIIICP
ncbi:MAG: T9SS type A sorting domain-containing protein [Bacteroidales bacterium]|nr:T9SS type A sorting domain-containing protein [Bacteroidales bacterium]